MTPSTLAQALVKAQGIAQAVAKKSKNTFHGYKYASAEAMIAEARLALFQAGLCAFESKSEIVDDKLVVHYRLEHSESSEFREFVRMTSIVIDKGKPPDKAEATASTYNLGYFLRGLLLLPREDAENAVDARDDTKYQPPKPDGQVFELLKSSIASADVPTDNLMKMCSKAFKSGKITKEQATELKSAIDQRETFGAV